MTHLQRLRAISDDRLCLPAVPGSRPSTVCITAQLASVWIWSVHSRNRFRRVPVSGNDNELPLSGALLKLLQLLAHLLCLALILLVLLSLLLEQVAVHGLEAVFLLEHCKFQYLF